MGDLYRAPDVLTGGPSNGVFERTTRPNSGAQGNPTDPTTLQPNMSRKVWGLAIFGLAIAIAVVAGTFYLLDEDEGSEINAQASPVFVDYTTSGGFAGITHNVVVYEDRSAVYNSNDRSRDFRVSEETMERLERYLPEAVEVLEARPRSDATCADCFQYDLTFEGTHYLVVDPQLPRAVKTAFAVLHEAICQGYPPDAGYCAIPEPFNRFLPPR